MQTVLCGCGKAEIRLVDGVNLSKDVRTADLLPGCMLANEAALSRAAGVPAELSPASPLDGHRPTQSSDHMGHSHSRSSGVIVRFVTVS